MSNLIRIKVTPELIDHIQDSNPSVELTEDWTIIVSRKMISDEIMIVLTLRGDIIPRAEVTGKSGYRFSVDHAMTYLFFSQPLSNHIGKIREYFIREGIEWNT